MNKKELEISEKLVDKFNKQFPIGSKVMLRKIASDSFPYNEFIVRKEAFVTNGNAVAFFEGISGYFSIEPKFIKYE